MATEANITLSLFEILGGVCLFIFGIKKVTKSLEDFAGASLRLVLTQLSKNRFKGVVFGSLIALSLQSSGAVMLMLVAFSNSGLIALQETISIMLGAGFGSTLTAQLLAFRVHRWAPVMLLVGYILIRTGKTSKTWDIGNTIFSFGLVFLGMHLVTSGTEPLVGDSFIPAAVAFFSKTPFFAVILGIALTTLFQSSMATIGLLLTFAFNGLICVQDAIPFIVGANIGSCSIAFLGSSSGHVEGRRIPWTELFIRITAGIIMLIFANYYISFVELLTNDPARGIAHAHLLFSITALILFLPFTGIVSKFIKSMIPGPQNEEEFGPRFLDHNSLSNPPVALSEAAREVLRQGDIVLNMMDDIMKAFTKTDRELLNDIIKRDDKVDLLQESITHYLTRLSEEELSQKESLTELQLLNFSLELEHVADVISKGLSHHVFKRLEEGYYFSDEGYGELKKFHGRVRDLVRKGLDAITLRDKKMAREIIEETKEIIDLQRELNRSHIERLHAGVKFTAETSTIHLDMLADLSRIAIHVSHIGYSILGKM